MNNSNDSNLFNPLQDKNLPEAFQALDLKQYGLTESDYQHVLETVATLDENQPLSIAEFGKTIAGHTSEQTEAILNVVQNKQLDASGEQLTQVVKLAKQINTQSLINAPQKRGIVGRLVHKFKDVKDNMQQQFATTKQQIDSLLNEVEQTQNGLKQRVHMLDEMYEAVQHEYHDLGVHIAAGLLKLQQIQAKITQLTSQAADHQQQAQQIFELNQVANNLEKRVHDLTILQQSALQTFPTIRMIQSNNLALIDKFYAVKNITIPAWKNQISLALSLNEQKNSVELAHSIDNATNDLLRRNAELLHQNSVNTARANQRAVIDIDTLNHVQNTLFKTVNDVLDIQKQGMSQRQQATLQLKTLQQQLNQLVVNTAQSSLSVSNANPTVKLNKS